MVNQTINENENFNFAKAFEESFKNYNENSIIKAKVEEISNGTVFLNFGYKTEAKIPVTEFINPPAKGDEVEIFLFRLEGRGGEPKVSRKVVEDIKNLNELKEIKKEKKSVKAKISEIDKNGVYVTYKTLKGFIPFPLFDITSINNPESYIGKEINFYIEKVNEINFETQRKKEDFIGNRKKYLLSEIEEKKNSFFKEKKPGDILEGFVKNITNFGIFVDVNGIDVLVRKKDIAWERIDNIENFIKIGEKVSLVIQNINREKKICTGSIKKLKDDPWTKFIKQYKEGDTITGTVTNIVTYGAFVKIIDGVEGLLHISDMSWMKNINNPKELLKVGQNVELKIIKIDNENKKINLSLKHLLENPWDKIKQKYPIGKKIKGKVKQITSFGCFVELEEGIDALLHNEDISWTESIKNLNNIFKIGDEIEAVIISCEPEKNKIKIGIKQLTPDPWKIIKEKYKKGDVITGKIVDINEEKGIFVEIVDNFKTLIPINQLSVNKKYNAFYPIKNDFKIGDDVSALITMLDIKNRKISISIKELLKKKERESIKEFLHKEEDAIYTLRDTMDKNKK